MAAPLSTPATISHPISFSGRVLLLIRWRVQQMRKEEHLASLILLFIMAPSEAEAHCAALCKLGKEDVQLMVDTGLDAYRFSISWPRLILHGRGSVNPKGLAYYNNLINELLSNGFFPIVLRGLRSVLEYFKDAYGNPPIYIHENGQMTTRNGMLDDESRVEYLQRFIGSLLDAVRNGSNAIGYFSWSFLDLFELLNGYGSSFGLYYVDLDDPNLTRYPKSSQRWFSGFLKRKHSDGNEIVRAHSSATI